MSNYIEIKLPFQSFKIKKEETAKRLLSVEELRTLRDYPVELYLEKYRDMFILMFYLIGINVADLFSLLPLKGNRIVYHKGKNKQVIRNKDRTGST